MVAAVVDESLAELGQLMGGFAHVKVNDDNIVLR